MNHRPTIDEECKHIRKKRRIDSDFSFFEDLPDELLERILTMVSRSKYARFVCWKWLGIVSDISFMKSTCIQRWGEDIGPLMYERESTDKKQQIIDEYFIPLVKDDSEGNKVDWNRYYKIRSNYEKFLQLERLDKLSKLKKNKLKKVIGVIHNGNIANYPEVSYRAIRFLCDLARINIEQNNISATDYFVVQTWKQTDSSAEAWTEYNTKICHCLFNLFHLTKKTTAIQLRESLMQKILNRFVNSTLNTKILIWLMEESLDNSYRVLYELQSWYSRLLSRRNPSNDSSVLMSLVPISNEKLTKQINTLYEATKMLFEANNDSDEKLKAVEIGLKIADQKDPEFAVKSFRLVADLAKRNESFEEDSLMLLSKVAMEYNMILGDEEYIYLLEVALRKRKILLSDPIPQFYIACSLLANLKESRVPFFNDEDLALWHRAFLGHNLHSIEKEYITKGCVHIIPKIALFGPRIIPYLPDYDRFLLEGQTHNPKLAAFYLCDILGNIRPTEAIERVNILTKQRTHPMLVAILAEGYERIKAIFGDLWTPEYNEMIVNVILESFPENKKNLPLKKYEKINPKDVTGKWKFKIKDVVSVDVPWITQTSSEEKAINMLMRYATSHSSTVSRSVQIQILNLAICYLRYDTKREFIDLLYGMPIIQSNPISDIAPQLLALLAQRDYDSKLLLRLVLSYPCAILIRLSKRDISDMNLICNKAIIASYFGIHSLNAYESIHVLVNNVGKELLARKNTEFGTEMYKILLHYAIQLRCTQHDNRGSSYCEYRENDYWPLMKKILQDPSVREFILQFIDDYDTETNFLRDLLPKYNRAQLMEERELKAWELNKDDWEEAEILEQISRMESFSFCDDLPDEIIERILAKHDKYKIARYVCRKWLGIVTAPSFIRIHCFQRWGEELGPLKYDSSENSSSEPNRTVLEQYFVPLVKDNSGSDTVDWKRYYKIRSNYEKFLRLERNNSSLRFLQSENLSSELKKDTLKRVVGIIHMGYIQDQPENK